MAKRTVLAGALLASLSVSGCNWTVFDDIQEEAPTRVTNEPDDYRSNGFGLTMAATAGDFFGTVSSRVMVNAGADSTLVNYTAWTATGYQFDSVFELCKESGQCPESIGTDIIPISSFDRANPESGGSEICFLVTVPATGGYEVSCESPQIRPRGTFFSGDFPDLVGLEVGTAGAPLGNGLDGDSALGIAVLGAPGTDAEAGALFRALDGGEIIRVTIPDGVVTGGSRLGQSLASTHVSGDVDEAIIAAGAPGNMDVPAQVVVMSLDGGGADLRACLTPPAGAEDAGFGRTLAFGDLDGDDLPDLVVGGDADRTGRVEMVWIYFGSSLPGESDACQGWDDDPQVVECLDDLQGVSCDDNGFGHSVATGDVDADGVDDLVVGAPFSAVGGALSSGAVYVYPGGTGGPQTQDGSILVDSSPDAEEEIGRTVITVPSALTFDPPRDEVLAGAPGGDRLYQFLCTEPELEDDSLEIRCQPE